MAKPIEIEGLTPDTRARDAAPLLIAARLADVERRQPKPGALDMDSVHDMRVAARRLRVALDALGSSALDRDERGVKALQDALGAVRDQQVQIQWLESDEARGTGQGLEPLLRRERSALEAAELALADELERWQRRTAPRLARRLGRAAPPGRLGGAGLRRQLEQARERVEESVGKVDEHLEPGAVHELRIRAKKLRYLAELLRPGFPGDASAILERVQPLLDAISELHDDDVRLDRLAVFRDEVGQTLPGIAELERRVRAHRQGRVASVIRELERWRAPALLAPAA